MAEVTCNRCEKTAGGLEQAPLPGEPGQQVLSSTCRDCWEIWRGEQVKLINENKLSPARPDHYEFLVKQMRGFLKLGGA
jgi:Fe-S cluster biosynthesis and repair protein YggX